MGIEASYRRITPDEFEKLHNDAVYASIYFGDDLETDEEIHAYFKALRSSGCYLELDKYWRSLHFLFTGDIPFASRNKNKTVLHHVFMGGTPTTWEATYGMVRYLPINEVIKIAEALECMPEETLKLRVETLLGSSEGRTYMEPHLLNLCTQLIGFFKSAAQAGDIVLLSFD